MLFSEYVDNLTSHGKCSFSLVEIKKTLNKKEAALRSSIAHLLAKGDLVSPAKGFYIIVPLEYQVLGCLPAEHFVPYLMEYWGCQYYAALLTAARYHGATHQSVQVFQVIVPTPRYPITCGKVKIDFIVNKNLDKTPIQKIITAKSMLTISTPEGAAMDLMNYPNQSGGLNHIATVLSELQESMKPEKLLSLAESQKILSWKQRLGYLLEVIGATQLVEGLKAHLKQQKRLDYIPLIPGIKDSGKIKKNTTWKIFENATIESDI